MMLLRIFNTSISVIKQSTYVSVRSMSNASVSIKFRWGLSPSDPEQQPVLFVGQAAHLSALSWDDVRCKLEPRVSEEAWRRGVQCVTSSPGDSVELWPRGASLASLPARRSRHAAPARSHALAKIVRATQRSTDESIVLVCRKRDVLASAVSIGRSFPLYHARSAAAPLGAAAPRARSLAVEIYLVPDEKGDGESEEEGLAPLDPALCDGALSAEELSTLQDAADATRLAARITDTPANVMDVDKFIEEACKVAKELDIGEPTIIRGEELKARGMGGIYGVGRAAATPPALVVLSCTPPAATETVAWVGKGIVYDTGGLSIKARTSMVGMKGDCGGAAAVLAAFAVAVKAKPTVNLHAVLCLAENAVGPNATRPDDIHQLYSGRTVEINNTDAEGRLVLSDGVVYASRDLKAETIVDVATLTGAQGTATGKYHAAIVSNDSRLEAQCVAAGLVSGDLAHALPFAPELHFTEFTSCVADMKNSVADRNNAQPSCAGLFILAHLGFDFPGKWLHVDMAAPAHCGERATGYGVSLLSVLFGAHTHSRLLRALAPAHVL
ncbi:putative aminopeptidase NPEPL1 granny smith protein isoform X2 [Anticarsia gemmatalis]|uniref:putative aminopeptidase NPEPL1 granny smith protein isoform X2 n=1 Tax=Anticarsia gemmatalis TaxID=129554 RepID=UPI003F76EE47